MAEWTRVGEGDNGITMYANLATIRKRGDMAKMWILMDFKTVQQAESGERYLSAENQREYNCSEEQSRRVTINWFSGNMTSGKLGFNDSSLGQWTPVRPGSLDEVWFKVACGLLK